MCSKSQIMSPPPSLSNASVHTHTDVGFSIIMVSSASLTQQWKLTQRLMEQGYYRIDQRILVYSCRTHIHIETSMSVFTMCGTACLSGAIEQCIDPHSVCNFSGAVHCLSRLARSPNSFHMFTVSVATNLVTLVCHFWMWVSTGNNNINAYCNLNY